MANFNGIDLRGHPWGYRSDLTPQLEDYSGPFDAITADFFDGFLFGTFTQQAMSAEPMEAFTGYEAQGFGQELFEKVIVSPRVKLLGSIVSDVSFLVDVWNTHHRVRRSITDGDVSGGVGVTLTPPGAYPLDLGPWRSRVFSISVSVTGDPTVDAFITFTVPGESGVELEIIGARIVTFDFHPDWSDGISEVQRNVTNVLQAYDSTEQRIRLRKYPRTILTLKLVAVDLEEIQYLRNVLYSAQARLFGVPLWPDAILLETAVSAGATSIPIDTTYSRFLAGGAVLLWRGMRDSEAQTISTVGSGVVTLAQPLQRSWAADEHTWIVPLLIGRIPDKQDLTLPNSEVGEGSVVFTCDQ